MSRPVVADWRRSAAFGEEGGERGRTLLFSHPHRHIEFVGEPRVGADVVERPEYAGLHVHRPVHDSTDPALLRGAGTHGAGLEGDHQRAVVEPPRTERRRRISQRKHLGVRSGIAAELTFVVTRRHHVPLGPHHDRTHGHVVVVERFGGFVEGQAHHLVVGHGRIVASAADTVVGMSELPDATVDEYLDRVGIGARPAADLEGLTGLMQAHLSTVPFENLDVFAGRRVHTNLDHSIPKIVTDRRGGWCFENNGAFAALLRSLGFEVRQLGAAVLLGGPNTTIDHLCLEVTLDRSWLVDVGFGDSFIRPLDLNSRTPQDGGDATYELIDSSQGLTLTKHEDGVPAPQYRFRRVHHELDEFTPSSDALQDDDTLHWSNKRFATRLLDGGPDRVTLLGDRCKFRRNGEETEEPVAAEDWNAMLQTWFSMDMPPSPEG